MRRLSRGGPDVAERRLRHGPRRRIASRALRGTTLACGHRRDLTWTPREFRPLLAAGPCPACFSGRDGPSPVKAVGVGPYLGRIRGLRIRDQVALAEAAIQDLVRNRARSAVPRAGWRLAAAARRPTDGEVPHRVVVVYLDGSVTETLEPPHEVSRLLDVLDKEWTGTPVLAVIIDGEVRFNRSERATRTEGGRNGKP